MLNSIKNEGFAIALILVAFFSGIVLTAATSGCDAPSKLVSESTESDALTPN
jgi:hypothetical protein